MIQPSMILPLLLLAATAAQPYDIVIRNGHVIDGTGSPWYAADVGIRRSAGRRDSGETRERGFCIYGRSALRLIAFATSYTITKHGDFARNPGVFQP